MTDDPTPDLPTRLRKHADLHDEHAKYVRDTEPQRWANDLREAADLLELAFRDGEVLVALVRPDGYEDVHPALIVGDAMYGTNWPEYRLVWPTEWEESE